MSWVIQTITIDKVTEYIGEANVKLSDENGKSTLFLNKFIIDMQSGSEAIEIAKFNGVKIFSGIVVDEVKKIIHQTFQEELKDMPPGIYEVSPDGVEKLK